MVRVMARIRIMDNLTSIDCIAPKNRYYVMSRPEKGSILVKLCRPMKNSILSTVCGHKCFTKMAAVYVTYQRSQQEKAHFSIQELIKITLNVQYFIL